MFLNIKKMLTVWMAIVGLLFPHISYTAEFILQGTNYLARAKSENGTTNALQVIGKLGRGSKIEIPDAFFPDGDAGSALSQVQSKGKIEWLSNPEQIRDLLKGTGKTAYYQKFKNKITGVGTGGKVLNAGYFFPVIVKDLGKDSTLPKSAIGTTIYLPLEAMFLKDRLKLKDGMNIGMLSNDVISRPVLTNQDSCPSGVCQTGEHDPREQTTTRSDIQKKVNEIYTTVIKHSDARSTYGIKETIKDEKLRLKRAKGWFINNFKRNLQNTCDNVELCKLYDVLNTVNKRYNVPSGLIIGLMTQESAGVCGLAANTEKDKSSGIMQVNLEGNNVKQLNQLIKKYKIDLEGDGYKDYSATELKNNFIANIEAGVARLINKFRSVNNSQLPSFQGGNGTFESLPKSEQFKWRKAISAYNGGQKYVNLAQKELNKAKEIHPELKTEDWKTLRAFYFNEFLQNNGLDKNKRAGQFSVHNVAYTEQVLGDGSNDQDSSNFAQAWDDELANSCGGPTPPTVIVTPAPDVQPDPPVIVKPDPPVVIQPPVVVRPPVVIQPPVVVRPPVITPRPPVDDGPTDIGDFEGDINPNRPAPTGPSHPVPSTPSPNQFCKKAKSIKFSGTDGSKEAIAHKDFTGRSSAQVQNLVLKKGTWPFSDDQTSVKVYMNFPEAYQGCRISCKLFYQYYLEPEKEHGRHYRPDAENTCEISIVKPRGSTSATATCNDRSVNVKVNDFTRSKFGNNFLSEEAASEKYGLRSGPPLRIMSCSFD
ncbi:MAG: transglycosylase SLT domain-containing protein [Halobacteriovoraceae bacterium]|nr:transglycosylase SLT domain-containing protein [Halobacteriovoraceae bacterium]